MKKIISTVAVLTIFSWIESAEAISITQNSPAGRAATAITSWTGATGGALPQLSSLAGTSVTGMATITQPNFGNLVATWAFASLHRSSQVILPASATRGNILSTPPFLALPDGGSTAILLSATLSGMVMIHRKLKV